MLTRSAPMKRRVKPTGPPRDVVVMVLNRSGDRCERCGDRLRGARGVDHHIHHRRPRALGGSSRPDTNSCSNLLALCAACHGYVESSRAEALASGWLVHQYGDPACVAVLLFLDRWSYLADDGSVSLHPPQVLA